MSVYKNENGTLKPIASNNKIVDQPLDGLVTKEEFDTGMKNKLDVITDTGRPVKATVIFSFDQAAIDVRATALEEYGFRGVFSDSGSVSNELMRELTDRGHDYSIYGGTGTRPALDGSVDDWYNYIAGSVDKLASVDLRYPTLYSCPSQLTTLNMIEACKKLGFKYIRCASISDNTTTSNSHWIYPQYKTTNPFQIAMQPISIYKGWDFVKPKLDEAIENNYTIVLFAHKPDYSAEAYTEEYFRQIVEYVHTKVSEGVLDCLTPREYYDRYRHENDFKEALIKVDDIPTVYAKKEEVSNIIDGIDYNDGAFVAATGTHETGYIEKGNGIFRNNSASDTLVLNVAKGEVYKISGRYMYATALYGLYDADGKAVSVYPTGTENTNPAVIENVTIVIPEGVSVLKASTYQTNQKILIVEKWDKTAATSLFSVAMPTGTLYKKKWCVCGDSFTAGDNLNTYVDSRGNVGKESDAYDKHTNHWKTYPWWIAKRNSMSLQWLAISGRAFTNLERLESPFSNSETPGANYIMIDNDCDYITFMFGLNESGLTDAEIGTKTDTTNATLWGAYNVVLEAILTANPSVKIGIIVSDSWLSQKYHDALIEIAKYWGIPYLDLKNGETVPAMIGPRISDYSPTARALRDGIFKDTTGHPTFESHKYRSTIIENFLRSL